MLLIRACSHPVPILLNVYYITRKGKEFIYYFTKNFPVKYFIGACLSIALFSECSSTETKTTKDSTSLVTPQTTAIQGLYKGDFDGSPIYININYSSGKHIAGYNVHKGLRRNLSGTVQQSEKGWELLLNEPGDHPFDGKFKLLFDANFATAYCSWTPSNTPSLKEKNFNISRVEKAKGDEDEQEFQPNTYSADHADINFETDGACVFHYYDKITDSTWVEQMTTVRGTWERKDSSILVNWTKNEHWQKTNSTFDINYQHSDDGSKYMTGLSGEGYEFSMYF
jgi:hypothetical protein